MKRCRLMASCFLALVIALPAAGARAASLDTVKTLIEQTALPMARENDTEERITGTYSPQELSVLIAAAREAGVTLDKQTSYVLRALRRGESYWEFETIEETCEAAFGGRFWEWPVETSAWYEQTLSEAFGYEYYGSDGPTEEDLPAAEAWRIAQDALEKTYEGAKSLADPALYMHLESFLTVEEEELGRAGRSWKLTFYPLDLIHAAYSVSVNTLGEVTSMTEKAQDWSQFTVAQLENGIQHHLPPRKTLQGHWSAQAWHIFRDMLPQAQRDSSWREEYDAYLASAYPLPDEADIPSEDALAIAIKDGGIKESEYSLYDRVLLADEEGRHIWKITLYLGDSLLRTPDGTQTQVSWEIDAKTGGILARSAWAPGDRLWRGYVLESVYQAATKEMLTAEEAVSIAADALRKELDENDIPYTDPDCFSVTVSCNERRQEEWQITFSPKDLTWGSGAVLISEADRKPSVLFAHPSQVDGDSLWARYLQVYGANPWQQETWVQFGKDMQRYQPTEWVGKLFKATEYPEESAARLTREEAERIAFSRNAQKFGDVLDATLIAASPHPIWKIVLPDNGGLKLYEIDAETGDVTDIEKYLADNPDFDHPIKRFTLHRVFAPVYVETFGPERLAAQEIGKAFGHMDGDCVFEVLRVRLQEISSKGETAYHRIETAGRTVIFRAKQPGMPSYRVEFDENWMTANVEIIAE